MEWDLKIPPWNLEEELDRDAGLSIGSVVDCSVDLKLGGLGEFGSSNKWNDPATTTTAPMGRMLPPPGPPKRQRAAPANGGGHSASCLVDGCMADLSKCREYHRRHKVCEAHSKTPVVVVRGQEQRFCQQCSRFHLLEEFDEVKRSCRKRLDGHNRRRRKPQPSSGNSGSLFPDCQGFSSYSRIFPTSAPDSNWTKMVKTEDNTTTLYAPSQLIGYQHFPNPSYLFSKDRKQITFFQEGETTKSPVSQLNLWTTSLSRSSGSGDGGGGGGSSSSSKMFHDGQSRVFNSDCALSLLSSPTRTSDINSLSSIAPAADRIPVAQPLVSSLQYGGLAQCTLPQAISNVTPTGFSCVGGVQDQSMGTVLASVNADDAEINCQSIFQVGDEGSSDAACQPLPFSWP